MSEVALQLAGIVREYRQGDRALRVLNELDLTLQPGEIVALVGPSGAGKSTLLQIAGLLDNPDSGFVMLGDRDCARLNDAERSAVRRAGIGFVFQFHHLLPEFTALENIVLPQLIAGTSRSDARKRAAELLELSSDSVSTIAYNCGFNNLAHFSRSFVAKYQISPSKYKMKQIGN